VTTVCELVATPEIAKTDLLASQISCHLFCQHPWVQGLQAPALELAAELLVLQQEQQIPLE
jgi:hypothetical protein